jgi:hypothetical protein
MWGKEKQQAFDDLKHRLCSSPILSFLDLQQSFDIETDASDYAIGVVLTQHGHPVAYHSETLSDTLRKYPTYDKEIDSIVQSCRQWKHKFWERRRSSTLIKIPCSSYRHRGNCRMDTIISGSPTCNSSISTSSIRHGAQIVSLNSSVDLPLLHSPLCSIPVDMRHLSGPNFIQKIQTSKALISSWVHAATVTNFHIQDKLLCHRGYLCVPTSEHAKMIWEAHYSRMA